MYKLYVKSDNEGTCRKGTTTDGKRISFEYHIINPDDLNTIARWVMDRINGNYLSPEKITGFDYFYEKGGKTCFIKTPKRAKITYCQPINIESNTVAKHPYLGKYNDISIYPHTEDIIAFLNGLSSYKKGYLRINDEYICLSHRRYYKYKCPVCEYLKLHEVFTFVNLQIKCPNCNAKMDRSHSPKTYIVPRHEKKYAVEIDGELKGFLMENTIFRVFERVQNMYPDLNEVKSINIKLLKDYQVDQIIKKMVISA